MRYFAATACLLLCGAPPCASAQASPEAVVQQQLDAYNAHDIAAFAAMYATDAELIEYPAKPLMKGADKVAEAYGPRFRDARLHAVIDKRIVMGNIVVDHEKITRTFPEGPGKVDAIVIYEVANGKIVKATLIRGAIVLDKP
jgi:hypothetical protein